MIALQPTLTDVGMQAAFNASNSAIQVEITHIAAGNQGYTVTTNANGLSTRTRLVSEQERTEIRGGGKSGPRQLNLSFALDNSSDYWVRELGFYLADGTLFAIWSHADRPLGHKAADVPWVIGLDMEINALPADSVTITPSGAPLEILMTPQMVAIGSALANMQLEQLRQAEQIQQISGA